MSSTFVAILGIQQTRLTAATARLDFAKHLTPTDGNAEATEQYLNLVQESYRDVSKIQGLIDRALAKVADVSAMVRLPDAGENYDTWIRQLEELTAELAGLDIGIHDAYMLL